MPDRLAPRILFIGNSFTQRNDLPGMIASMAARQGVNVTHELVSVGGASLRTHWNAGRAAARIASGAFDSVVLQEQSTLPIKNAKRMAENIRLFDKVIRDAGARTVLYLTWARRTAPETQADLNEAYESMGQELNALVIPVGRVWQTFLARHDQPVLYDRDASHPSLAGSYLAACVFVRHLIGLHPHGIDWVPPGISADMGSVLQTAAAT